MTKTNRDSRESELRDHDIRPQQPLLYESHLDSIATLLKRPGYKLRWVNYARKNEPTMEVEKALRDGWEIISRDRLPTYRGDVLGRNPIADKAITSGDVLIMEMPEEIYNARLQMLNQKTQSAISALRGVTQERGTLSDVTELKGFH